MKFILTFIFCSGMANSCLPPVPYESSYLDLYTCLDAGYKESIVKMEQLGRKDVNEYGMFLKFYCVKDNSI